MLEKLNESLKEFTIIKDIRGKGLFIGIEFKEDFMSIVKKLIY